MDIEWNTEEIAAAVATVHRASSSLHGTTINDPQGCGSSSGDAAAAADLLQQQLKRIREVIPAFAEQLAAANKSFIENESKIAADFKALEDFDLESVR